MFGGMAQDDTGAMFRLSDMFELTISQRWWRQARPSLAHTDWERAAAVPARNPCPARLDGAADSVMGCRCRVGSMDAIV